ncbi:hypothetical protein [Kitasatospora sp. KL5]|uniref:hypothetical protein n=1 Tax=Kitasatospora sp. KL5 TaxID=3425125 RepID=UPI003D6E84E6
MNAFAWSCLAVVWAFALSTSLPALARGRVPGWWRAVGDPRLWGAGQLVLAVGAAWSITTAGTPMAAWPVGPAAVFAGLGVMEWARRRRRRRC